MRLLIVTQKVDINDPILGFFHRWIQEFAKLSEQLTVICLEKGEMNLPGNVKVLSLGKEENKSTLQYIVRFYKYIWQERGNYDYVFVHMNPVYVLLGGVFWKMWGKKICLWYTHKNVDLKLRLSEKFVNKIFTASKESFRLVTPKLIVAGHGIDVSKFTPELHIPSSDYTIISVGRMSSTKKQYDMVAAFKILSDGGFRGRLVLIGGPITKLDADYEQRVKEYIEASKLNDHALYVGSVSPEVASDWYKKADMFINLSETGSMDKAVLEAMASGLQVVVSNEAFKDILPGENYIVKSEHEIDDIVKKVKLLSGKTVNPEVREYVAKNHSLVALIPKLVLLIQQ